MPSAAFQSTAFLTEPLLNLVLGAYVRLLRLQGISQEQLRAEVASIATTKEWKALEDHVADIEAT